MSHLWRRWACVCALVTLTWAPPAAQQQPFVTRVEVERVLLDVRVFDRDGRPIAGLAAGDFEVAIGGREARVETVEWIGATTATGTAATETPANPARSFAEAPGTETTGNDEAAAGGRLVVFLVQRDLEPLRILGLMQMGQMVDELLAPLTSRDRVAVLSFDSRLRLWSDFTGDLARVRTLLAEDVILRRPGAVTASAGVSLYDHVAAAAERGVHGIERALARIGEALEPLPGAKSIVLLGYGFGRFNGQTGGVVLMDGYEEASAALQRARVAVFSLNVTRANYNSLQAGLQTVAAETGGMYASTYEFPQRALRRLASALAGHYVLFVEKPALDPGVHGIEVRLRDRRGTVVARRTHVEAR